MYAEAVRPSTLALLSLLGCSTPDPEDPPRSADTGLGDSEGTEPPLDDEETPPEEAEEPEVTEETVADQDLDDSWIFDDTVIHDIAIELPAESVDALNAAPYTYAPGAVTVDGERVGTVGVRLRGKIGSFRYLSGKPKFKIDFNQYVDDQRFYGLETLSLNNAIVDCSYLKEAIAYRVFEAAGVPSLRTAYARVTVNDAPYGLYILLETPDDRYLNSRYADPSGNLYDGKYVWYGGGSYQLLDFASGVDHLYQLEEGEDVGNADISAVSTALATHYATADFTPRLGEVLDWDAFHREQVAEQWVGQNDGYALNKNNYRVYFNPETGLMEILPWDMDYSFLQDYQWGRSWASPYGYLAYACRIDATCNARQREIAAELLDTVETLGLSETVERLAALSDEDARNDPRRECSWDQVEAQRNLVRSWVGARSGEVRAFWGLP